MTENRQTLQDPEIIRRAAEVYGRAVARIVLEGRRRPHEEDGTIANDREDRESA